MFTLLLTLTLAAGPTAGEFPDETLTVGTLQRQYRLVVPKSVDLAKPAALVVAFHGLGVDNKDVMPKYTKLNDTAAKHGFILAYPNALDRSWGLIPEKVKTDLAFFDALVKEVGTRYKIDANRVYVLGMSNGGYFAHTVGAERSKVVAAVASHSGLLGMGTILGIKAERKFPVLIVHGDKDRLQPIDWARDNRTRYEKEGHEVTYVELAGHGHSWAAKENVNETIWAFFAAHPLDAKPKAKE